MKEAVEDKKVELKQSGTKIPAKDVDVLRLINTSDLYGLINDGINKYDDHNTVQGFINNMVGNTDSPTVVEGNNKMTDEDIKRPLNPLGSSIPESTLRRISKKGNERSN